ncbi:MAG: hypothetical protein C0489_02160 [Candidatus Accumulibacter sp.]|nr:hypothetical protein [Accumulibacter sp.]
MIVDGSKGLSQIAETPACSTAASRFVFCSLVTIRIGTALCQLCRRMCSTSSRPSISGML